MLRVALNRDLRCPDLWDIFISSANWCLERCRRGGLFSAGGGEGLLPPAHPTLTAVASESCGTAQGWQVGTFPTVGSFPLQNIALCLFALLKNEQTQPTTELKGIQKKCVFYSLLAFLSPWMQTLAFPILGSLASSLPTCWCLHTCAVLRVGLQSLSRNWTQSSCCSFSSQNSKLTLLEAVKKTKAQKKWKSQLCSVVGALGVWYSKSQLGFHFCIMMPVVVHQSLGCPKGLWVSSLQPIDPRGRQLIFRCWETLWIPEGPWT